ncbi:MAG: type II toxin-antitoxin system ParD family antitoxin [Candidatus Vogelbacteria bacterium]|nr:type II toxin-antitoxin system ParD family antitoxin [Candidatus Vogelbacteria bacterium]
MTTLSIPITSNLEEFINSQIKTGRGANKADVVRRALRLMAEEEVVRQVLLAQQEVKEGKILRGNLREIAKNFK